MYCEYLPPGLCLYIPASICNTLWFSEFVTCDVTFAHHNNILEFVFLVSGIVLYWCFFALVSYQSFFYILYSLFTVYTHTHTVRLYVTLWAKTWIVLLEVFHYSAFIIVSGSCRVESKIVFRLSSLKSEKDKAQTSIGICNSVLQQFSMIFFTLQICKIEVFCKINK